MGCYQILAISYTDINDIRFAIRRRNDYIEIDGPEIDSKYLHGSF